jgi:hypothetical protein
MSKRKENDNIIESGSSRKTRRFISPSSSSLLKKTSPSSRISSQAKIKLNKLPVINSLIDLINIGRQSKLYENFNTLVLWDILPHLEELNNLIGMNNLKESVFYQVIYYLQGLHLRNKDGDYLHTIITGKPGTGKCLGFNTPVIMFDGTIKNVQDVEEGDQLMGDDSTVRNVLSVTQGTEDLYEIQQNKGDNYIVNKSHILSLKISKVNSVVRVNNTEYRKFDETSRETVIDISVPDYLKLNKTTQNNLKGFKVGVEFEEFLTEIDEYTLGFWLGNSAFERNEINIPEASILYFFYQSFPKDLNSYLEFVEGSKYRYKIMPIKRKSTEQSFLDLLNNLKILEKNEKFIPHHFKVNSRTKRLRLLAGIIDSAGVLNNNCYEITEKNQVFAGDIVFLCRSLGFYTSISETEQGGLDRESYNYYRIIISGDKLNDLPLLIERKKVLYERKQIKDALKTGIIVNYLGKGDYYGFTLDGNSRFLLGDFTVTHNTTVAKILAKIYNNLGIIHRSNNTFKIAHREDLVGEYLGSTAVKTKKLLTSCLGGVIFVDELYALGSGHKDKDTFSKESIDTICAFLSENKNNFCFIGAGYKTEIEKCFFSVNEGLKRRFQWIHEIDDYTDNDLAQIFIQKVKEIKWDLDSSLTKEVLILKIGLNKEFFKDFGGSVENILSKIKLVHSKRVLGKDKSYKFKINTDDLENALQILKKTSFQPTRVFDYFT